MGMVILIIKIMPNSAGANLSEIKSSAEREMLNLGAKSITFEEKPIAFGLIALYLKMALTEEKGTDIVETILSKIADVSSVTIEDYRRAFG